MAEPPTLTEVARAVGVAPPTLRRWVEQGIVPLRHGEWTPAAVAQARIVARLRGRGHSLAQLRRASHEGRLAFGYIEDLFPRTEHPVALPEAARRTGLEPALIERIWAALGFPAASLEELSEDDVDLLAGLAAVLD